ncbi:MAG: hypothetical protein LW601_07095 [Cryomorphaceae bacterium]|nr:hypothetical protein [Cryomorphaceae bacterium]
MMERTIAHDTAESKKVNSFNLRLTLKTVPKLPPKSTLNDMERQNSVRASLARWIQNDATPEDLLWVSARKDGNWSLSEYSESEQSEILRRLNDGDDQSFLTLDDFLNLVGKG